MKMRVLFLAIAAVLASALSAGAEVPDTPVTRGPTDERIEMGGRKPDDIGGPEPSGIPVITIREGEFLGWYYDGSANAIYVTFSEPVKYAEVVFKKGLSPIGSFKMLYPSQGLYGKISTNGLGSGKMTVHFYPIDMNGEPVGSFYGEFTNR
ncbi:hypothetical protein [uncultured Alistipes sp.]|uniref:hypothetical protein n=1 Tax=uncultured Alistipes sp. TaxID=538949 RepID=UPI00259BD59A|nr:hypothetical protein [uncultured Alistipes sp.]